MEYARREAIKAAKELHYSLQCRRDLRKAKTESELYQILRRARLGYYGEIV